jgi:hypothetical protein
MTASRGRVEAILEARRGRGAGRNVNPLHGRGRLGREGQGDGEETRARRRGVNVTAVGPRVKGRGADALLPPSLPAPCEVVKDRVVVSGEETRPGHFCFFKG